MVLVFILLQSGLVFGGTWHTQWKKAGKSWDLSKVNQGVEKTKETQSTEPAMAEASTPLVTSSVRSFSG